MSDSLVPVKEWLSLYADPKANAVRLSASDTYNLLTNGDSATILDLRNDREPGIIRNSVNVPANSISGYKEVKKAVIDRMYQSNPHLEYIIVHCNSSKNRATKVAGWIQDYIEENKITNLKVAILDGGITGWLELEEPFSDLVEKYP